MRSLSLARSETAGPVLVCGALAAAVNWAARIALSQWLDFGAAVTVAYAVGMVAGFTLYRHFVWPDAQSSLLRQIGGFIAVNAVSALVVLATSLGLVQALGSVLPQPIAEALAHGAAIAVGAVANYLGHGEITFGKR